MSPASAKPAPPSATTVQIAGDKTNGYVVLDTVARTVRKFDPKLGLLGAPSNLPFQTSAPPPQEQADDKTGDHVGGTAHHHRAGPVQGIAGNAANGVVYFIGNQMAYLADIGNPMSQWKPLREMPFASGTQILGICGDTVNGIVVHNGDLLALAPNVMGYPTWQSNAISPRLPIRAIVGDCINGVLMYCDTSQPLTEYGDENKTLPSTYLYSGKPYGPATPQTEPPIVIEKLFGNGTGGFLAFGENQVYSYDTTKLAWTRKASLAFGLNGAAGSGKEGLLALVGTENFIVNTTDFSTWTLLVPGGMAPVPAGTAGGKGPSGSEGTGTSGHIVTDGASDMANALAGRNAAQSPSFTTNT